MAQNRFESNVKSYVTETTGGESIASKEELLESIKPGMKLNKNFFMRIYAYELTWPGFKDVAIKQLNDAGCSHALEYYNQIVGEYEKEQEQTLKEVAHWYRQQCDADYERKKKDAEVLEKCQQIDRAKDKAMDRYLQMSDSELLSNWQRMKQSEPQ